MRSRHRRRISSRTLFKTILSPRDELVKLTRRSRFIKPSIFEREFIGRSCVKPQCTHSEMPTYHSMEISVSLIVITWLIFCQLEKKAI